MGVQVCQNDHVDFSAWKSLKVLKVFKLVSPVFVGAPKAKKDGKEGWVTVKGAKTSDAKRWVSIDKATGFGTGNQGTSYTEESDKQLDSWKLGRK